MRVGLVRNVALGLVALVGLGLVGCDDKPTDFGNSDTVRITTNPSALTVPAGITTLLQARTENEGAEPTWEEITASVDGSCGAATVTIAEAASYEPSIQPPGQFDITGGTTLGSTCINLSGGGESAVVEVTVVADSLQITGAPDTLNLNSSVQLSASLMADDGTPVSPFDPLTDITWSSDDDTILTVDDQGNVEAVGVGGGVITATWTANGVTQTSSVTISVNSPTLEITAPATLVYPATADLSVALINPTDPPADFGPFDENTDVTWSSSNTDVLTVDAATGEVASVGGGEATITVTWNGNETVTASVDIAVTAPAPTLTSLDVTSGPVGTYVTITGTGLLDIQGVFLGGDDYSAFQDGVPTSTNLSFWMPNPGIGGPDDYDVQVGLEGDLSNALTFTLTSANGPNDPLNDSPFTAPPAPPVPFTVVDFLDDTDVDDFSVLTMPVDGTLIIDLDWDTGADLDILMTDVAFTAYVCTNGATGDQPEQAQCALTAGSYLLWINDFDASPASYILSTEIQ